MQSKTLSGSNWFQTSPWNHTEVNLTYWAFSWAVARRKELRSCPEFCPLLGNQWSVLFKSCLLLIVWVQMERLLIAEGWRSTEWPLWLWWLFFFFNILSQYILRKRGQKAGRLSWVEAITFSNLQATESFLSSADKTGFCHNSDEDKKKKSKQLPRAGCLFPSSVFSGNQSKPKLRLTRTLLSPLLWTMNSPGLSKDKRSAEPGNTKVVSECYPLPDKREITSGRHSSFWYGDNMVQAFLPHSFLPQKLGWRWCSDCLSPRCSATSSVCRTVQLLAPSYRMLF